MLLDDLRVVTLNSAYHSWKQEDARHAFCDVVALKLKAYQNSYGENVLPIDGSDFAATHILVYKNYGNKSIPIMGFRTIEIDVCSKHKLPFPALNLARSATEGQKHLQYLEKIIEDSRQDGKSLFYLSSWAIDPTLRNENKEMVFQLTSLFGALIYLHHSVVQCSRLVAAGVIQFRVPNILALIGFRPAELNSHKLEPLGAAFIHNEPTLLMDLNSFTPYASKLSRKYESLWNRRTQIYSEEKDLFQEVSTGKAA